MGKFAEYMPDLIWLPGGTGSQGEAASHSDLPADGNFSCDGKAGGVMNLFILQDRVRSRFSE